MHTHSRLSLPDFEVLVHLTDVPEKKRRSSELAKAMHWEKSRLSHQLARMEKRGLIARQECSDDGRGTFVVLTAEGWEAIQAAAPSHVEMVRRLFFDAITDEQVDALTVLSERVLDRLEADDSCQP
jgi:DNA-binding MarR family transcriptional regulator